jgi:hypothetical protein
MRLISQKEKPRADQGFFNIGSSADTANKLTNGAILIISTVLKHMMSSAAEAEIEAVFINAKEGAVLRTPLESDNTTATGYSNGTIKPIRTKATDMHFYCRKERVKQGQFNVYWGPGYRNLADYFTKHHSPAHHKRMREIHIYMQASN